MCIKLNMNTVTRQRRMLIIKSERHGHINVMTLFLTVNVSFTPTLNALLPYSGHMVELV